MCGRNKKTNTAMKIQKQKDGTYTVHFDQADTYPMFGGYGSIEAAKQFVHRTCAPHRVVFIHLIPRTWWVVKF